jgi:hypothetical protein
MNLFRALGKARYNQYGDLGARLMSGHKPIETTIGRKELKQTMPLHPAIKPCPQVGVLFLPLLSFFACIHPYLFLSSAYECMIWYDMMVSVKWIIVV